MSVTFQLPDDVELMLRGRPLDLAAEAKEALLVSLYKRGELNHKQLSSALGLDRFATDAVLNKHQVTEDLPSIEDVREQLRTSRALTIGRE
jgi:hypothetical protein